ncbi:MAG: protein translocase subunit SecF, partial [Oceanospirillaceae bacterium]|nr:protein translocase subunit SecF [Oceanospirillaceae bacterium]
MSDIKIINFMALRKAAGALSIALVLGAMVSLAVNQLQFGLDFTGGTLIEVGYEQAPDLVAVRSQLQGSGFDDAVVQN